MIDVWQLTGCSKDTFNKWLVRGNLKTDFPQARQGVPREFTKQNALEVYFLVALTNAGFDVGKAEPVRDELLTQYANGSLPVFVLFNHVTGKKHEGWNAKLTIYDCAITLADGLGTGDLPDEDAPPDSSMDDETLPAVSYSVIFPHEIAARVDKAFDE